MKRNVKFMLLGICSAVICLMACRKNALVEGTSKVVNMTQYLLDHPEDFSLLNQILERSETASFLNAYGSYTFFAPTNTAIKAYLSEKGKTGVDDISAADWKTFVRFHLLEDSIPTSKFNDGKLYELTMYGQYLTTASENIAGVTKIRINRQANVINLSHHHL